MARTTGDLVDTWGSVWGIGFGHNAMSPLARPGGWARPLQDGTMAVGLFNLGWQRTHVDVAWTDFGLTGPQPVRDVWQRKDVGVLNEKVGFDVPQHGAVLLKVGKPKP